MYTFIITASHNLCGNYYNAYSFKGFAALYLRFPFFWNMILHQWVTCFKHFERTMVSKRQACTIQ